ncbi:hypothetical protein D3C80_1386800 [compost metagenome]
MARFTLQGIPLCSLGRLLGIGECPKPGGSCSQWIGGFSGYVSIGNLAMGMFRHRFMETLTVSHRQRVTIDPHRPTQGQRCIK